ncbi:hypothetical protein Phi4:1_gp009 [Cellulophaga phage phi4:1]|uniref:Uncharacterized protein n=5 Tax=Lightbulbvirus TaxID=1918522 RepID=A0A0S2MWC7_9CAUD|nr:hypothetical protein Phi4:1_gp009 [Cellulophaga phage phi4:1]YP_008241504.1 hypothetical protein Phi17:2_gp009 [Cellulophaga phage phi17:2]ALO80018.1 hypothetical protein Phi4113_009 [Cellulophaga phage phi4:1_13]ALO80215.1 hypothetical protein Phi4118_009 [Cellulophaga phage phi4:1_18]ALO80412.1 hypothetical protein Phi17218_009 [Cellulophaga phage phi17:2_18]AGO47542.1 hypothetical protein Phi17:2_gp009 [Cellulophaga phage phi17:2]AGO49422.1 hypothetical protein Phi4:1_gp009 [Cellulophag
MEIIKIDNTDIFLEDLGEGRGKIIIANTQGYNFSYFWGSMGSNLKDFLLRINESYFLGKLSSSSQGNFSGKKTVTAIRKTLREDFFEDLPWYKNLEAQKELREKLKHLEGCDEPNSFIYECRSISETYWDIDDKWECHSFTKSVDSLLEEPWHYFQYTESNEQIFLKKIFKELKKIIKKDGKKETTLA